MLHGKPPFPNANFSALAQRDGADEEWSYSDEYEPRSRSRFSSWQLLGLCLCCLATVGLPILAASFFLNSWAQDAMEASGFQTFGVATTVASVDISMLSGRWSFGDLEVQSPVGYGQHNFMSIGSGVFDIGVKSIFFSPLVIQELSLADVQVNIDQHVDGTSNAKMIMEHIDEVSDSAASKRFNEALMNKKVTVDKITFTNIVTRLCLHPSCEMSPPPYFVIKTVEVNDVGKQTGGVFVPDLFQVIVRAVVIAAIKAAPHQLGNPLAESLGAGLLQALDYAQLHYDLGGGMQAASAQIGIGGGILSRGTAQLGRGVATTLQKSEPDMIKALDKALGLDHPTDKVKQAAQKMVNKNAKAAAGGLAAAVSNFSKALSQGELDVAGNVSSALAAVGSALENQKDPLAGRPANSEEMARNAQYAMNNFTSMVRQGEQSLGKIFKPKPQAPNPFQDVFKNPFEKAKPASNPLEAIGSMLPGAQPATSPSPQPGVFQ